MLRKILSSSRFVVIIAVVATFLIAIVVSIYGAIVTANEILAAVTTRHFVAAESNEFILAFVELIDVIFLAIVFYIISLGLYSLFVDDKLPLPTGLQIHTFDDLKDKLVGVLIIGINVAFFGEVITWEGERNLLFYGAAIALVTVGLTLYLFLRPKKHE